MKHITKIERPHFQLLVPKGYKPLLDVRTTERAIWEIKRAFTGVLEKKLNLQRASAPVFVDPATGLQDRLNGVERPVGFDLLHMQGTEAQVPQSLAKWKRDALRRYGYKPGEGIWTDMNAIRRDEKPDSTHSFYVDQYDWERVMRREDRTLEFLKGIVRRVYSAIKATESRCMMYGIKSILPDTIKFVHTEELERDYPALSPRERENAIAKRHGAVFIRGIGADLPVSQQPHDGRSPDYDNWTTVAGGRPGLNGDIFVWYPVLQMGLELSSMGIRVDRDSLQKQLIIRDATDRLQQPFHQAIMDGSMPLSVGGGVGQSRLAMFLLRKAFVGEVQVSLWPADMQQELAANGIPFL
jgi:aspartate--ammonia ligase